MTALPDNTGSRLILVTGDPICDHNYYRGNRPTADSPESRGFRFHRTGGGALLLKGLIERATADLAGWHTEFGLNADFEALPSSYHSFCLWEPRDYDPTETDTRKKCQVWRAVEPLLGYGASGPAGDREPGAIPRTGAIVPRTDPLTGSPEIIVIDDAGLGYRDARRRQLWPFSPAGSGVRGPRWVVIKLTGAIESSEFWTELVSFSKDRLIVIVSADQLRRANARISRGLSWEATAEDLTAELEGNPRLGPLVEARHLIITFRSAAAFWRDNSKETEPSMLVFDARRAEGEWAESQGKGVVFGFLSCFTAAIVRALCREETPDIEAVLAAGLGASRELHRMGHGRVTIRQTSNSQDRYVDNPNPGFPFDEVTARICQPTEKFVSALIPATVRDRGEWMMLDEWQLHARSLSAVRPHLGAAEAVAILGPEALQRFPVAQFGALQTVDRKEIEGLRTIKQLISAYERTRVQRRPLSVGVFGPPGAGKSFGVIQIAKAVLSAADEDILTFNVSQFSNPGDLNGAFHRIRDRVLSGRTPLVFWDEFDSQDYRWLQYLLAPMQDGIFQEGEATHPIGKCIFVFAGATSPTFESFGPCNPSECGEMTPDQAREVEARWLQFVLKKGPDFKSRLAGYLDVLGPNPRRRCIVENGTRHWEVDPTDQCYPIRRAFFIRSQFRLKDRSRLHLDRGVLRALLEIPEYKAGSRSLEFVCRQLQQNASGAVPTRSHVPGEHLLGMHVNSKTFWEICERDQAFLGAASELAKALHEGCRAGVKDSPEAVSLDVPFTSIPMERQKAYLEQAMRIPRVLKLAKLQLKPGSPVPLEELAQSKTPDEEPVRRRLCEPDTLELMAEAEHNGWMLDRLLAGLGYSASAEDESTRSRLIPYSQLEESDKDHDRETIAGRPSPDGDPGRERFGYVDLVKIAGFRVTVGDGE